MAEIDPTKLADLEDRLAKAQAAQAPPPPKEDHHSMAQMAWRMVIELVAGIGIGAAMGFGLDYLFGTKPLFLIVFIGLGFAAGVRTMMRSAEEVQKKEAAKAVDDGKG